MMMVGGGRRSRHDDDGRQRPGTEPPTATKIHGWVVIRATAAATITTRVSPVRSDRERTSCCFDGDQGDVEGNGDAGEECGDWKDRRR